MPTPEEVTAFQLLRSKFLAAVYDNEAKQHQRMGLSSVVDILAEIGLPILDPGEATRLVRGLEQAGLIEGMGQTLQDLYSPEVRMTAYGRSLVEDWATTPDKTSPELPISYNNVYNTTIHTGPGSINTVGSTNTTIAQNNQFGAELGDVISAARTLLANDTTLTDDEREEYQDNIAQLEEQVSQPDPNKGRIKRLLKGFAGWAGKAIAVAGAAELERRTGIALQAIG